MLKVVGCKRVQGTFEGNPYDNYNVYCIETDDDKVLFGVCPQNIKVKSDVLHRLVKPEQIKALENKTVMFYYDAYKKVIKVEVIQ